MEKERKGSCLALFKLLLYFGGEIILMPENIMG